MISAFSFDADRNRRSKPFETQLEAAPPDPRQGYGGQAGRAEDGQFILSLSKGPGWQNC